MFRAQLVDLWDDLLALCERDPDFHFLMDGQTVVVDDYLAIRPEARPRLERAVRSRQIQIGPWYTLPDEFLVSGETLVRNLQRGIQDGDAYGGAMRVGYLPDSFGHAAQMPQLYRQFGFRHAVVWRGVPSAIDRLVFHWEAPDGSRILTAYMGTTYADGVDLPLDGPALAARLRTTVRGLTPYQPGAAVLLMNGNDHVLPQAGLTAAARSASELLGWSARVSRLDDYLAGLPEDEWPAWNGELRASSRANVLMGTLSVRMPDKQAYFAAGLALERRAEALSALSGFDASGLLREAWTLALQNAAHDTACGSGIDAVAREARQRSESISQIAQEVVRRSAARLRTMTAASPGAAAPALVVWNPSPFARSEPVETIVPMVPPGAQNLGPAASTLRQSALRFPAAEVARLLAVLDERAIAGEPVRAVHFTREGALVRVTVETDPLGTDADLQEARRTVEQLAVLPGVESLDVRVVEGLRHRVLVQSGAVPGCGVRRVPLELGTALAVDQVVRAGGTLLQNDRIRCEIQADGTLTVHHLLSDTRYESLGRLVDQGDAGDEYNFSPVGEAAILQPADAIVVRVLEAGPLRGTLEISAAYRIPAGLGPERRSRSREEVALPVRMRVSLATGASRLDCELELDHRATDHRLRAEFPLPYSATHSDADGAYQVARRPAVEPRHETGAPEWELPTYPMRTFVDASDGRRGLTVITHGQHEYELLPGPSSRLALTVLRAVGWLSRDDFPYRTGHAGPPLETPEAQVPGRHRLRFTILFHAGDWKSGSVWREAERALLPLEVLGFAPANPAGSKAPPSIMLEPEAAQMTACVPRADGYDLRVLNAASHPIDARLTLAPAPAEVAWISLGGEPREPPSVSGGLVRARLRAWEIATFRVRQAAAP